MNFDKPLSVFKCNFFRSRAVGVFAVVGILVISTVAASDPFTDLVCRSLIVKTPDGRTVIELADDGSLNAPCVPLGMMLPYFGDKLPKGFVWADGESRWPDKDWVPEHLRGKARVPNMNGRTLRGVDSDSDVGLAGGSDHIASHSTMVDGAHEHAFRDHVHSLPELTGQVAQTGPFPPYKSFSVKDAGGTFCNPGHFDVGDGPDGNQGQHRHELGGNTSTAIRITESKKEGVHSHNIGELDYIPAHITVRWIIRIQ